MRFGRRPPPRRAFYPRRRSNVQVTGCGCCLPLTLGFVSVPVLGARLLWRQFG